MAVATVCSNPGSVQAHSDRPVTQIPYHVDQCFDRFKFGWRLRLIAFYVELDMYRPAG